MLPRPPPETRWLLRWMPRAYVAAWFVAVPLTLWAAVTLPFRNTGCDTTSLQLQKVVDRAVIWSVQSDRWPRSLSDLFPEGKPLDPWGRPFLYACDHGRILVLSLGSDGLPGGEGQAADVWLSHDRDLTCG